MTPIAEVLRNLAGLPWLEPGERSRAADRAHQLQAAGWTRLAASGQVGRTPVARQVVHLGESRTLLLWRTRSRQPVAMDALCPHKPFSMVGARLVGDALECPVHRRRFGPNGLCVNRPDGKPAKLLPVREEAGYLWLLPPGRAADSGAGVPA